MKRHSIFVPMTLLGLLMFCAQQFLAAPPRFGHTAKKIARQANPPTAVQKRLSVRPSPTQRRELEKKLDALPLQIEVLKGQPAQELQYIARGNGYLLQFAPDGMSLTLMKSGAGPSRGAAQSDESIEADLLKFASENRTVRRQLAQVGLRLAGANKNARVEALDPQPGTSNYFIGKDPAKWQTRVPNFSRLRVRQPYEGIDLIYYGNQRKMEFDFVVAPGADPKKIILNVSGAKDLSLSSADDLWLTVPGGKLRLHKPVLYQEIGGKRKTVDGRFLLRNKKQIAFHVGKYDRTQPLVIDPVLSYSTFFGGSNEENSLSAGISGAVAVDSSGNAYFAGSTVSPDFPFTPGVVDDTCGTDGNCNFGFADVFVTKLNAAGNTVLYSTFFGGSLDDLLGLGGFGGLDVDSSGNAYLAGATRSPDFPTLAGAFDTSCGNDGSCDGGRYDAFLLKLNSTGNVLLYSSFYGGSGNDLAGDVREDGGGGAYFTGFTTSTDLPLVTAYQGTFGGVVDAFFARINITGSGPATFSSYLGGAGLDAGIRVERDASGNVYVTGRTESLNFPTTVGALQTLPSGAPTYKTTNSGASWTGSTAGTNNGEFLSIALAPSNPLILFAGSAAGVYKSTDAGATWAAMNTGLPSAPVHVIAIDPLSPLIVYAGTGVGVYKTTDGGANWAAATSGIGSLQISSLVIDPSSPNVLYAGLSAGAIYKSTNSAASWTFGGTGVFGPVNALAMDPNSPSTLFAGTDFGVFKTTNGASTWTHTSTGIGFEKITALAVNPTTTSTVYAGAQDLGFFKSTNGGGNWTLASSGLGAERITSIVVDPISSSTLYAGTSRFGVFKSVNDAGNWTPAQSGMTRSVNGLAIDAATPSTLYAATRFQDAFLFRITNGTTAPVSTYLGGNGDDIGNGIFFEPTSQDVFVAGITASTDLVTTGSAFQQSNAGRTDAFVLRIDNSFTTRVYATYLGGSGSDRAIDVAVNSSGEAWVVGETQSLDLPLANSFRPAPASDVDGDAFIAKLNSSGGALLFSTYWGGSGEDVALGVALDASGNAHITGYTSSDDFPAINVLQSFLSGSTDAFLMKITDAVVLADLSVTGGHSPEPVPFGQPVNFSFSVTNNGPSAANNVFVYGASANQTIDVFLTSANPSQGACSIVNNIVCNLG
ncbi:MAG TPA: SBBP repeat-containing protein, partial [Candidatus Nitrosotenuis sp.]|nr:SBBP repeat-containing protein [Candidatus Nitrosotenuis sp.]